MMQDIDWQKHKAEVKKLKHQYPTVPEELYDIEASPEMAELYLEEFGQ